MIFLPSVYKHNDLIEGNERFKLGNEDLEKLKFSKFSKFSKFLNFLLFETPIFQNVNTFNPLEVLEF